MIFKDVCFCYYVDGFFVLKGISFDVFFGEKIGIVGCIGVGKFLLLVCLLCLFVIIEGEIIIDGIFLVNYNV